MTGKERLLLFILACINFANIVDFMIMMPLQEYLIPIYHITPFEFSVLVFAYAASAFLASFTASFFADRFDRKKVLLFAFSGFLLGTAGCGFAESYEFLFACRIIAGLFGGMISAQAQAIVGDTFPYEKRGRAMGALMGAFAAASVVGVPASLWLAATYHWQTPFMIIAIFGIILLPLILLYIPKMNSHVGKAEHTEPVLKTVMSDRNMQMGLLMMFTLIFSHFIIIPTLAAYLEVNLRLHKTDVALMYFIGGFVSLFSSVLAGKLADKYGKHIVFYVSMVLSVIPVIMITHMTSHSLVLILTATSSFFLIAGGRFVPAQALIASVVQPHQRGSFLNLNASLTQLATGLSSLAGGLIVIKDAAGLYQHYDIAGYVGVAVALLCLFFSTKVRAVELGSTVKGK